MHGFPLIQKRKLDWAAFTWSEAIHGLLFLQR